MRTKIVQILFFLGVVGALAEPVAAGEYQLILGQGEEVCEACLKNLQQQPAEEAICDRQYAADLGLRAPEWEPLDLREHTELYKRASNLIDRGSEGRRDPDLGDPKQLAEFLRVMEMTRASMSTASVDIDNDGRLDQLVRYQSGNCKRQFSGFGSFYQSAILIMAEDGRTIDYVKTDPLVQHQSKGSNYPVGIPNFQLYQIFAHKGTIYVDKWDGGGGSKPLRADGNSLSVYRVAKGQASKLCQIRLFPPDAIPY